MPDGKRNSRQRLIAPIVLSEWAAHKLLAQMRESGSDRVLPPDVWRAATRLPGVIAAKNHT